MILQQLYITYHINFSAVAKSLADNKKQQQRIHCNIVKGVCGGSSGISISLHYSTLTFILSIIHSSHSISFAISYIILTSIVPLSWHFFTRDGCQIEVLFAAVD